MSLALTACLFVLYYGYILLIAVNKPLLAQRMGGVTPIGIPLGAAVIVGSWILTAIYIVWANRYYDPEAATAPRDPSDSPLIACRQFSTRRSEARRLRPSRSFSSSSR